MLLTLAFAVGVFLLALATLLALDFVFDGTLSHASDVARGNVTISTSTDGKIYNVIDVAAGATVSYVGLTGLPAAIKCYSFVPTFAGTMTINYASGADDVVTLAANRPVEWHNLMGLSSHFVNAAAITSIDFHSTDTAAGTVTILIGRDDTP